MEGILTACQSSPRLFVCHIFVTLTNPCDQDFEKYKCTSIMLIRSECRIEGYNRM